MNAVRFFCGGTNTLLMLVVLVASCIKPYDDMEDAEPIGHLVVEGFLNAKDGTCTINLSRTQSLGSKALPMKVVGAQVALRKEGGAALALSEITTGKYFIAGIQANPGERYQLAINTSGKTYTSDFVEVIDTPPIEDVTIREDADELRSFVSTSDPSNNARYYRWEYDETYEYTSGSRSNFEYTQANEVIPRREQIFLCWKDDISRKIMTGTTEQLGSSVIRDNNFTNILKSDARFDLRYSMLVKQYAISRDEYAFLENLKKNTQNLGTLFDPLPSQVSGNIHSDDPNEPVFGYFSVYDVEVKRVFTGAELGSSDQHRGRTPCFPIEFIPLGQIRGFGYGYLNTVKLILDEVYSPSGVLTGYNVALSSCVDCRIHNLKGTNKKPDWWQ